MNKYIFENYYDSTYVSIDNQKILKDTLKKIIIDQMPDGSSSEYIYLSIKNYLSFLTAVFLDELEDYVKHVLDLQRRFKR